jgi:hypothetical protein
MPEDSMVAVVAPKTERVWEALTVLENDDTDGVAVRVKFPFDCEILGVYPSVAKNTNTGKALPSLDDLLVDIQLNQDQHFTSRFAEQDSNSQKTECTLGAWRDSLTGARTTSILMTQRATGTTQNDLVVTFKWKNNTIAAALFEDVQVGLAFNIRKLNGGEK